MVAWPTLEGNEGLPMPVALCDASKVNRLAAKQTLNNTEYRRLLSMDLGLH